jgi:probable phosphoglycerate mutase
VLLRHGRTEWNATARAQGHTDVPLDETGHAQAAAAAEALSSLGAVRLWTSDLARASQTAAYVGAACGLVPIPDPRLREYDVGERAGMTIAKFARRFPEEYAAWVAGADSPRVQGAESTTDVRIRVVPALSEHWDALGDGETGIVVLHGACLKVGLLGLLRWPWEQSRTLRGLANCGWAELEAAPDDGRPRLVAYNRTASPGGDFAVDGPVG